MAHRPAWSSAANWLCDLWDWGPVGRSRLLMVSLDGYTAFESRLFPDPPRCELCKLLRHDSSHHALPSMADYPLLMGVLSEAALHQVFSHSSEKGNSYGTCPQQGL